MHWKKLRLNTSLLLALSVFLLSGCGNKQSNDLGKNLVTNTPSASQIIGDNTNRFLVVGGDAFVQQVKSHQIQLAGTTAATRFLDSIATDTEGVNSANPPASTATADANSLTVGFPITLLNERQVFGGVITKVSDTQDTNLGDLKLTDLTPLHVRTIVAKTGDNTYALALLGCASKCTEASDESPLLSFPISGVDVNNARVMVDLSSVGTGLNLIQMIDPDGKYTKLKTKSSQTVSVDYSLSTLVFDVATTMVPVTSKPTDTKVPTTLFTVRWYLRLDSVFNPAFESRTAAKGVGFFMTERSANSQLQRWSLPTTFNDALAAPVHYFVKNVPKEYQAAFASCFDEWNAHFVAMTGKKIFSYEFIDADDAKAALLVPGDVRYNIVEWDLVNQATYGGLGPSIANQFTGEIFSANVLIQGPTIIKLYTDWFATGQKAHDLVAQGKDVEADALMQAASVRLNQQLDQLKSPKMSLTLGNDLAFRVNAQNPAYEDPAVQRNDFDTLPPNVDFKTYMAGYFHDMLTHELGHNLGLRHNFRGSLFGAAEPTDGKVSVSVMEYLGRDYRYMDHVGSYDLMAIGYGYQGTTPTITNEFCTDEDVPTLKTLASSSAECSSTDASPDPFSFFEGRLNRAVDLLTARGQTTAPTWTEAQMDTELNGDLTGVLLYSATADASASHWTNFFGKLDRPASPSADDAKTYVLKSVKNIVCDPSLPQLVAAKSTDDAKKQTQANLDAFRAKVVSVGAQYKTFTDADLKCTP